MNIYLISDTHFNHAKIATYCDRPENFTELLVDNWRRIVRPEDVIIPWTYHAGANSVQHRLRFSY